MEFKFMQSLIIAFSTTLKKRSFGSKNIRQDMNIPDSVSLSVLLSSCG